MEHSKLFICQFSSKSESHGRNGTRNRPDFVTHTAANVTLQCARVLQNWRKRLTDALSATSVALDGLKHSASPHPLVVGPGIVGFVELLVLVPAGLNHADPIGQSHEDGEA